MKQFSFFTFLLSSVIALNTTTVFAQDKIPSKDFVTTNSALTPGQVEEVKKVIHDYLVASPEVLIEASKSLQEKQRQKTQEDAEKGIKDNFEKLINNPTSLVLGNPEGKVIVVEFVDYQCGHCKTMSTVLDELIKKNKDLKVVVKELPIFGEKSEFAAKAALASIKQGKEKAAEFHKALFSSKTRLSDKIVMDLAKSLGLKENLEKDMSDALIKKELDDNIKLAGDLKLPGTPAFVVTNQEGTEVEFIPGAIPNPEKKFQELINKARESVKPKNAG